jgi:hypothetical protein
MVFMAWMFLASLPVSILLEMAFIRHYSNFKQTEMIAIFP